MGDSVNRAKSIFLAAIEKHAPDEWPVFLDGACAEDAPLRKRVEQLLRAHAQLGSFHETPEHAGGAAVDQRHAADTTRLAEGPGTVIGPYKLLEQIGEGGFGVVFMAEQTQPLRRKVALKIVKPGMDTRQVVARFEAERQALARMDHPHIARVLDAGATETGRPYFVMELVRGIPITDFCDANKLTPRQRLELFIPVCQAVQHAHQKGIIHRDLKPSNVLVTLHDGVPVIKVIDFGIAKALGEPLTDRTLFTGFAQMLGTPRYMSPEQAELSGLDVDTRSDIYSLGVLLYELLTGTAPLDGERLRGLGYDELRRLIREEEAPRPSTRVSTLGEAAVTVSANRQSDPKQLSRFLRGELDWIVMKALEKDRSRRYETASALAADVQRYLADEAVEACPPSALYRLRKLARRHRGVLLTATVVAAVVVLAVTALAVSTTLTWRANQDLHQALERERQNAYYQRIALAEREWSANNLSRMLELLEECPADLRGWEWHYLQRLRLKALPPLRHESAVFCAVFSPGGERIASASQDGKVTIWDAQSGQQLVQFRAHDQHARSVAFSPDGRLLATTSWDRTVKIWEVQTLARDRNPSPLHTLTHQGAAWHVVFSSDGKRLASAGNRPAPDGPGGGFAEVKVWDPLSGKELCTLEGQEREIWSALAFSPDGQLLATGHLHDRNGVVGNVAYLWDANTGRKLRTFAGHTQPVQSVAFSPDGRYLASGSAKPSDFVGTTGELKLWEVSTGRRLLDLRGHLGIFALAFSPDGRRLASAGVDQTIKLWDPANGKEVLTLRGHSDTVRSLAFSPNGQQLVSASHDMTVRVWDATPLNGRTDPAYLTLRGHQGDVAAVVFSPDGQYLVSTGLDQTVKVWDRWTGEERATLAGYRGAALSVAFHPEGRWLASGGSRDPNVRIWDTATWKVVHTFPHPGNWILSIAFSSPDGKLLAVSGPDSNGRIISIWDTTTRQEIHRLRGHSWNINSVAFDRTGQLLASAGGDGTVRIWDARAGQELVTLQPRHEGSVTSVAFSPNGKYLASGSLDRTVKVWSTATWKLARAIPDAQGGITSVAFAPDSRRLAWAGTDATVKVADADTGQIFETLHGHIGWVTSVAFSPDGQQIASASADGTVKIWQAPPVVESPGREVRNQDP
jgi:WD40 repeat protein/serine/threonine protein kinase